MRLTHLRALNYRSLRDVELDVETANVLIGANASGKSNLLNALTFLNHGLLDEQFDDALRARGGLLHVAWKGEAASDVTLETQFADDDGVTAFHWSLRLRGSARCEPT